MVLRFIPSCPYCPLLSLSSPGNFISMCLEGLSGRMMRISIDVYIEAELVNRRLAIPAIHVD